MAAQKHFIKWLEGRAQALRAKCGLPTFAPLDPFVLASKMDVPVFTPHTIPGLDPDIKAHILTAGAHEWDAATLPLPDDSHVIIINPMHCRERQHASLMEEIAHIFLGHKPIAFREVNGIFLREWKQGIETQAFWVGSAALVPERVMKGAITRRMTAAQLAKQCVVSEKLIEMREKVLGLKLSRNEPVTDFAIL